LLETHAHTNKNNKNAPKFAQNPRACHQNAQSQQTATKEQQKSTKDTNNNLKPAHVRTKAQNQTQNKKAAMTKL